MNIRYLRLSHQNQLTKRGEQSNDKGNLKASIETDKVLMDVGQERHDRGITCQP